MTSTTIDVFAQAGYSVATRMVDRVDNQGEPCEHCQVDGRVVDATIYGTADGVDSTVDCCVFCVPTVIAMMDPCYAVHVELGDLATTATAGDDRMHNQDCTCVHPDAL